MRRAAVIFLAAVYCSCGPPEKAPPAKVEYTPAKALYNLKLAYNAPDYETYEALFSAEKFALQAEKPPPGLPAPWRFREEIEATRSLFRDAYHIVLEMETAEESVGTPPAAATEFLTKPLAVRVRVWREPTYCFYARGKVTFGLSRADPSGPWVIAELIDETGASYADVVANEQTGLCSWTDIKWYYLRQRREANAGH
jgi:hypothetical protein